jgi:DNA repair exonuclease SbcCD ATPase subunit
MLIKKISIRNFKSFGNNIQTIDFNNKDNLILLYGENGAGKSSLQESIDFTLFGIVRGKEKKRISQLNLPNRINGSLETSITFINDNNDEITIERGLKPTKLKVIKNGYDFTQNFKNFDQNKKDKFIGFSYDIYKSFISISLNDFTNFINLNPETKRKLLNKLFHIEELDKYYEISKNIIKNNLNIIEQFKNKINFNNELINSYKKNISDNSKIVDYNKNDLKNKILEKRTEFTQIQLNIKELKSLIYELNNDLKNRYSILKSKQDKIDNERNMIIKIKDKIDIYNMGKCPICNTNLKSNYQKNKISDIVNEKLSLEKDLSEFLKDFKDYKSESLKIKIKKQNLTNELNGHVENFNKLKNELLKLKTEYNNFSKNNLLILDLEKKISNLKIENSKLEKDLLKIKNTNKKYKILNDIFSTNGIRKNIIKNIVKPINIKLKNYLKELESPFDIKLDDEFNSNIYERYITTIHPETLSTGESRKINISIALSYLDVIRNIQKSNLLFLDEIFANVDEDNIYIILKLLKKISQKYNMTTIVVNQEKFGDSIFDKTILIEKDMFSSIIL